MSVDSPHTHTHTLQALILSSGLVLLFHSAQKVNSELRGSVDYYRKGNWERLGLPRTRLPAVQVQKLMRGTGQACSLLMLLPTALATSQACLGTELPCVPSKMSWGAAIRDACMPGAAYPWSRGELFCRIISLARGCFSNPEVLPGWNCRITALLLDQKRGQLLPCERWVGTAAGSWLRKLTLDRHKLQWQKSALLPSPPRS